MISHRPLFTESKYNTALFSAQKKKYLEFQTLFLFLANQIVMRAAFLEDENGKLQKEVDETINMNTIIRNDVTFLSKRLSQYQCNRQPQATAIM